jgi:hypothetical protein
MMNTKESIPTFRYCKPEIDREFKARGPQVLSTEPIRPDFVLCEHQRMWVPVFFGWSTLFIGALVLSNPATLP